MPRRATGFSALELLLVILTLAVLAALFVNALASLPERAKVAEALGLAGAWRSEMALYYANYGEWPDHETLVHTSQSKTEGKYTRAIAIEQDALTVSIDLPRPYQLSLRPVLQSEPPHTLRWLCGYAAPPPEALVLGENYSDIPVDYLPHTCR